TTDIIFLQKLKEGELPGDINWTKTGEVEVDGSKYPLNQYYIDHPDMVLGDYVVDKLTGSRLAVKGNRDDITEAISEAIEKNLPKDILDTRRSKAVVEMSQEVAEMADSMLEGGISLIEGKLYRKIGTELVPITKNVAQIKQLVQIRELAKEVLSMQRDPEASEAELEAKRKEMKSLYDSYVKKYSNLLKVEFRKGKPFGRPHVEKILGYSRQIGKNKKTVFTTEPETYLLKGLEIETQIVDQNGNVKQQFKPSQLLTTRTYRVAIPVDKVNNAQDGLVACLNEFGYLDMDHISKIYGKSETEIVEELGNKIFHDPLVGWVTADEYLSGNVKKKLREAQERAEYEPEYERNVEALSSIIPKDIPFTDINVSLGDGWVPFEITEKVVKKILGFAGRYTGEGAIILEYSPFDNKWNLRKGSRYRNTAEMSSIAAGIPKDPLSIVKIALNNSDTIIKQTDSEGKTYVNQEATNALKSKVKEIRNYLKDYLAEDLDAMNQVEKVYNEKFNNTVPRDYEKIAEVFEFPNMNPEIELRPHQKNAIVRALLGGNSLLAHGVGAGKTYEQIAIAMEAKRLGLANKPLLVVPNTKLTDFENDAKELYPGAKVLALSQDDFDGNSIKRTLALAALNDWDMVIVRHSSFSKIPVSPATQIPALQAEIQELEAGLADMAGERGFTIKKMEKRLEQLRVKLDQYQENRVQYEGLMHFEDMGFDMLIVDEAHEYKNYPLTGRATAIKGLASGDADKARDMMIKSGYIRKLNGGNHGVVFATGTPISNSMAEVFVMFKYLRPDLLQEAGISNFDAWTDAFADIREVAEISARGEFRNKFQFKSFVNLPELITLFREFTDIKMQDDLDLPLPKH
ncbi:MAG: DEAD/DEAH box helicase family protein, partial [Fastidiosipilaceae bacterium]